LIIKSKYRKSGNVIILNEVPNDVMINNTYLEIVIYNIVSLNLGQSSGQETYHYPYMIKYEIESTQISHNGTEIDLCKMLTNFFSMYKNSVILPNQKELAY
jgi:hypothetical protein